MRTQTNDKGEPKIHVAVRLSQGEVERIDALIPRLSTDWHEANRSDVLRAAIVRGLPAVEAGPVTPQGSPPPRKRQKQKRGPTSRRS